jgi:hypothetical protein
MAWVTAHHRESRLREKFHLPGCNEIILRFQTVQQTAA